MEHLTVGMVTTVISFAAFLVCVTANVLLFKYDYNPTMSQLWSDITSRKRKPSFNGLGLNFWYGKCKYCGRVLDDLHDMYDGFQFKNIPHTFRHSHILTRHIIPFLATYDDKYFSSLSWDKPGDYYINIGGKIIFNFEDFLRVVPEEDFKTFIRVQKLTGEVFPNKHVQLKAWMYDLSSFGSSKQELYAALKMMSNAPPINPQYIAVQVDRINNSITPLFWK